LTDIGFFSEMGLSAYTKESIKDYLTDHVDYDKTAVIAYLSSFKHFASCPKNAIDCITGETISPSFLIYKDDEYCWPDFLIYHIRKYNIKLPKEFVDKVMNKAV